MGLMGRLYRITVTLVSPGLTPLGPGGFGVGSWGRGPHIPFCKEFTGVDELQEGGEWGH